jgi:hypothetical protein
VAGALLAIAATVLMILLTGSSRTFNATAHRATPVFAPAPGARGMTRSRSVINPETGLMHGGGYPAPSPTGRSHGNYLVTRPHAVLDPETGLPHGA